MAKSDRAQTGAKSHDVHTWIARDAKSGRFVEVKSARTSPSAVVIERVPSNNRKIDERRPGRFRGQLVIGPEFFEPLSDDDLAELSDT